MCRLKGAGGRLDVNLAVSGSGTKWTNPSEGDRIDLTVYRLTAAGETLYKRLSGGVTHTLVAMLDVLKQSLQIKTQTNVSQKENFNKKT